MLLAALTFFGLHLEMFYFERKRSLQHDLLECVFLVCSCSACLTRNSKSLERSLRNDAAPMLGHVGRRHGLSKKDVMCKVG